MCNPNSEYDPKLGVTAEEEVSCIQSFEKDQEVIVSLLDKQMAKYQEKKLTNEKKQELWEKICARISPGVELLYFLGDHVQKLDLKRQAAGDAEKIPRAIPLASAFCPQENVYLCIEPNDQGQYCIQFRGGSYEYRKSVQITFCYSSDEKEIFHGRTIAMGGGWFIDDQKYRSIEKIELRIVPEEINTSNT